MSRAVRLDLGDLAHLTPEQAELYAALYAERNRIDPAAIARPWLARRPRSRKRAA